MHDVADSLAEEAQVTVAEHDKEPFTEIHHICESLSNHDLEPLLAWATAHHDALEAQNSSLEFTIHKLKYIQLLKMGPAYQADAITYARNHFRNFVNKHEKGVLNLRLYATF